MINESIGKYRIIRLLGEGGMAAVYEAKHEMLGHKVAVKILNPILSSNNQIKERFRNEAKLMASLDHVNIARVIDFDEQPNQLSIVMEYLEGEDLNQKIKRGGALIESEVRAIFSQTLLAFQYAHEKGVVHRDIKPSNIFILSSGQVKILDFGIAKLFGQNNEITQTGMQVGTPVYMSPEQVKSEKNIDFRSDIYSLGVTMYYAIQGRPPYNAQTDSQFSIFNKIVFEPLPNLIGNSKWIRQINRACEKNRENRFQSCSEWLSELSFQTSPGGKINDFSQVADKSIQDHFEKTRIQNKEMGPSPNHKSVVKSNSFGKNAIYIFTTVLVLIVIIACYFIFFNEPQERTTKELNQQQSSEQHSDKSQKREIDVLNFLKDYYNAIAKGNFKAEVYFSESVDQYIQKKHTTPSEINAIHRNNNEFQNAQSVIVNNEIDFSYSNGGVDYYNYMINFTCFRASKKKRQFCKVKVEVGIDKKNKIKSYREIEVYDLKFE